MELDSIGAEGQFSNGRASEGDEAVGSDAEDFGGDGRRHAEASCTRGS